MKLVPTPKKATPPASPSSPSMRLSALMTPTTHSTVKGRLSIPSGTGGPKGLAISSMRKPSAYSPSATAAAR